ncbi:unnamed protein product [Schistosoma rodhaini]|uniref:Uncharacterized protein n=3 Tax=Schistosoma rodhaini TaxID=6188 RepID=A0AA85GD53_9TREM|nr:unnamed protein product [Schistosoma rodhaini]
MDTSMEDLFSDFDKSTVLVEAADTKKNSIENHNLMVLTTETIGNETIRIEGVYQASTQSLCLVVELHENSSLSSCINLEIPYQYPSSSTNLSETENIPIHICTLCDKNHFMNIITYPQHQTSTVFADLSSTSSSFSSMFACSKRLIDILCDIENKDIRDNPDLVRLCSLPNGLVYAIWYTTMDKKLHCSVAFPLSCCKSIVTWAFIRNPAANSTVSRIIDNTLADNHCTQIENNTVNDLLIGLTKDGEGIGVWFDSSEDVYNKKVLNITEFSLPQSPDPITKCRAQGSWLHVITQSGHLMSVHFSLQLKQCNDNNNGKSTRWNLLCQSTNFPRLPIHLSPVNNIEQWIKSYPRWRNLNVCDFTRLADGHLGSVDSRGCKTRLVDLLSSKSEIDTPVNYTEQQLNQTFMELIKTKYQMKSYLACLLLLNRLSNLKVNIDKNDWSQFPLDCKIYLTSCRADHEPGSQSPLELIVDITVQNTTTDDNLEENINELLFHSDLNNFSLNNLAQIILFKSYINNNTKNYIISDYLEKYLYIVIKIEAVRTDYESSSLPLSSPSSSNMKDLITDVDNNVVNNHHSLVYTYRELWFSSPIINNSDNSKLRRFIIPSVNWLQIFHMTELNNSSLFQQELLPTTTNRMFSFDGGTLRVDVQLEFQPPILPQYLYCFNQKLFKNEKKFDHSPIFVTIGHGCLDCLHFLYQIENNSLLKIVENENPMKFIHTMHININDSVFQSIISDIFKNSISFSSNHHENFLKLMVKSNNSNNGQLFYCCLTHQSVKFEWSVNLDPFNFKQENKKEGETSNIDNNNYSSNTWCFTISSICLQTLWSVYKAIELRQKISLQKNNSIETFKRPTVEQLRLECSILKKLLTSLHDIQESISNKDNNNNNVNGNYLTEKLLSEPKCMLNFLLDSYCVIRKTAMSSSLFYQ